MTTAPPAGSFLAAAESGEIRWPGVTLDEPPSTVAIVRGLLLDYEASRPRSRQRRLGPSELGTPCARQIGLKLAGVPRQPDYRVAWAPMQGTAVHTLMDAVLTLDNERRVAAGQPARWLTETPLTIAAGDDMTDIITGHGDAYDLETDTVVDWKHVGKTALAKARRLSVPLPQRVSQEYRVQQHLYGLGHENAGRRPRWVRLVLLARSHDYDESAEWTEPYRPDVALWAVTRYYAIRDAVTNLDAVHHPERLVEVNATPGPDACKWCPFRRPGPPVDGTGCAGDTTDRYEQAAARFAAGLI